MQNTGDTNDIQLILDPHTQLVTVNDATPTISARWDKAVQQAVINSSPGPTIASRAYGILHTAMFDAWAAYDPIAVATQLGDDLQVSSSNITDANKEEAMSFAAYRVLTELFPTETDIFYDLMRELGFDPNNNTTDTTTAAGIGNVSAEALMEVRRVDGSNQLNNYVDNTDYTPVNPDPDSIVDLEKWTPEYVPVDSRPGDYDFLRQQEFLTPQWGNITPFALESGSELRPEAPQPFLLVDADVDLEAETITLKEDTPTYTAGQVLDIDKKLIGEIINPEFIAQAQKVVDVSAGLNDEQKLVAEFWEDGGGTSFPPGTWMTFGQFVSARDDNTLDEDAQLFFALGNAVFDAGVATWEAKTFYDYVRPVRAIRELGELGLIGELNEDLGGYAIEAWTPNGVTQTILASEFLTYQTPGSDPSPPFAEYTSGHSAFSASAAEVLRSFTGSDDFGASVTFEPGESRFEPGITPTQAVTLEWETFSEAADEAGISRIYGGIHFDDGDLNGRALGREVGSTVFDETQSFINGGVDSLNQNPAIKTAKLDGNDVELIDLRSFTGQVTVDFTITREADFNNEVYFYQVDDVTGTVNGVTVEADGYVQQALGNIISPAFSTTDDNTENGTVVLEGGSYLGALIIANGNLEQAQSGIAQDIYFSYLGANTDNGSFDHIKLLDDGSYGFEDLANGGDQDFNDIVISFGTFNSLT